MDLQEALQEIPASMDAIEEKLDEAQGDAENAESYAENACSEANSAEEYAKYAKDEIDEARTMLSSMRDEFSELQERIDELLRNKDDEDSVQLSDLQKDIAKHKVKVLRIYHGNPGITAKKIAEHMGIGEFLVKRIIENEQQAA